MEICIKWNLCRVCLEVEQPAEGNQGQMTSIFNDDKLAKQIYDCSGMKPNDSLPNKICQKCMAILKYATNFRKTCRNSDEYLQSVVNKTKSATTLFNPDKIREDSEEIDNELFIEICEEDDADTQYSSGEKRRKGIPKNSEDTPRVINKKCKESLEKQADDDETNLKIIRVKAAGGGDECAEETAKEDEEEDKQKSDTVVKKPNKNLIDILMDEEPERENEHQEEANIHNKMKDNYYKKVMIDKFGSECSIEDEHIMVDSEEDQADIDEAPSIRSLTKEPVSSDDVTSRKFDDEASAGASEVDKKSDNTELYYILNENEIKRECATESPDIGQFQGIEFIPIEPIEDAEEDEFECKSDSNALECIEYLVDEHLDNSQLEFEATLEAPNTSNTTLPLSARQAESMRRKTGRGMVFVCDICGNNFTNRSLLNYHMRIHRNERNYECELCFKRFNAICNLTAHMRVHTGEKPFECQFCGRRFTDRSTHIKHERIHTNEKPFVCNVCGKSFSLSTTLRAHEKIHTGEKPFRCESCDKSFKLPHQLKAHKNTQLHKVITAEQAAANKLLKL